MSAIRPLTWNEIADLKWIANKSPIIDFKTRRILLDVPTADNAYRGNGGNGHNPNTGNIGTYQEPDDSRFMPPALRSYMNRIGASQTNFKRWNIWEHKGQYRSEKIVIKISDDGNIECKGRNNEKVETLAAVRTGQAAFLQTAPSFP
jgi:hypothetical protein